MLRHSGILPEADFRRPAIARIIFIIRNQRKSRRKNQRMVGTIFEARNTIPRYKDE